MCRVFFRLGEQEIPKGNFAEKLSAISSANQTLVGIRNYVLKPPTGFKPQLRRSPNIFWQSRLLAFPAPQFLLLFNSIFSSLLRKNGGGGGGGGGGDSGSDKNKIK